MQQSFDTQPTQSLDQSRNTLLTCVVVAVAVFGTIAPIVAIYGLWTPRTTSFTSHHFGEMLALLLIFSLLANWSVKLPSGATWRPAMALITVSMFMLPPRLTLLIAIPGLIIVTALSRVSWWRYPLTFGHVGLGLYAGALVYRGIWHGTYMQLPSVLVAATAALAVHLFVNRLLSACIVVQKANQPFLQHLRRTFGDLNWGHFNMYVSSVMTAIVCQQEGWWGLLLIAILQIGIFKSVTYYSRMETWERAASTDGLTRIGNRVAWDYFLRKMATRPVSGTLVIIDLDNFKSVNDAFGHVVGDQLLREVASLLQTAKRKSDYLFRYGGDEFVMFFVHDVHDYPEVYKHVELTIRHMGDTFKARGWEVEASIGMATTPTDAQDIQQLLEMADARMYETKSLRANESRSVPGNSIKFSEFVHKH